MSFELKKTNLGPEVGWYKRVLNIHTDVIHVYTTRQILLVKLNHGIFKEYLMGGACGTYGEQENYIRRLIGSNLKKRCHLDNLEND